jgi:hypothetical protein
MIMQLPNASQWINSQGQIYDGDCVPGDIAATEAQISAAAQSLLEPTIISAVQSLLDSTAQSKGYDNIISACSYAAQAVGQPFQAEGAAFLAWRSTVWNTAYAMLAQVSAGTITMPTVAQALMLIPTFVDPSTTT